MNNFKRARLAVVAALIGGTGAMLLAGSQAWAASQTSHDTTISFGFLSSNPPNVINLNPGPPAPSLTIPSNCPFDNGAVFTLTGNGNFHQTSNKNGFWTGGINNGDATLSEGVGTPALYTGHGTAWFGIGTNQSGTDTSGQFEESEQFHFEGTSTSTGQKVRVDVSFHGTMNNNGVITNFSEGVSC